MLHQQMILWKDLKFPFHAEADRIFQRWPQLYIPSLLSPHALPQWEPGIHPLTEKWGLYPFPLHLGGFVTLQLVENGGNDVIWFLRLGHGQQCIFCLAHKDTCTWNPEPSRSLTILKFPWCEENKITCSDLQSQSFSHFNITYMSSVT